MTDSVLERYRTERTASAFAALVERHIDAVYSAALRQSSSLELAKAVTRSVFVQLAGEARRIHPETHLASWLQTVTRRQALRLLRHARRRRGTGGSEGSSAEIPGSTWRLVRPVLDEALEKTPKADREWIIRRFFDDGTIREIAARAGLPEFEIQKAVSQALDRLRAALVRRGVNTAAAPLAAALSNHAVEPAPLGLAEEITAIFDATSPAVRHAAVSPPRAGLIRSMAVVLSLIAVTAAIGLGVYRHLQAARLERLREEYARISERLESARSRQETLAPTAAAASSTPKTETDPLDTRTAVLARRIQRIQDYLARVPGDASPQMSLLTDSDWILVADDHDGLDLYGTDARSQIAQLNIISDALIRLDGAAYVRFRPLIASAMRAYRKSTGKPAPDDLRDLLPYFDPPIDASMLRGYSILALPRDAPPDELPRLRYQRFHAFWTVDLNP